MRMLHWEYQEVKMFNCLYLAILQLDENLKSEQLDIEVL